MILSQKCLSSLRLHFDCIIICFWPSNCVCLFCVVISLHWRTLQGTKTSFLLTIPKILSPNIARNWRLVSTNHHLPNIYEGIFLIRHQFSRYAHFRREMDLRNKYCLKLANSKMSPVCWAAWGKRSVIFAMLCFLSWRYRQKIVEPDELWKPCMKTKIIYLQVFSIYTWCFL